LIVTSTKTYEEIKASDEALAHWFDSRGQWTLLTGGVAFAALGARGTVAPQRRQDAPSRREQTARLAVRYARPPSRPPHP
jgi:hypothetical protein